MPENFKKKTFLGCIYSTKVHHEEEVNASVLTDLTLQAQPFGRFVLLAGGMPEGSVKESQCPQVPDGFSQGESECGGF